MIEDARLSNSHVINHYKWLFNLGFSYVDEPLAVKNSDNTEQLDSIIGSMASVHLGLAYYIKPYWQVAANTSFSKFKNNIGESKNDFQDIDVRSKIRLYNGKKSAFTLMPVAYIPLEGGETVIQDNASPPEFFGRDQILSDSGFGLGVFGIYEYLFRNFQISLNIGYRYNDKAKFVDVSGKTQIDKTQVLVAGLGLYYPFHKKVGLNVEFLSNFTSPFFNKDINPNELYVGLSSGLRENIHGFVGAGLGNFLSDSDGNDYRVVAGLKFTPGLLPKKKILVTSDERLKPSRVIEDNKRICDGAYLFKDTNLITILFPNDSTELSEAQQKKISKVLEVFNSRSSDVSHIEIYGYASVPGGTAYNQDLGYRRAQKVKSIFTNKGVNPQMISVLDSKGETVLLEPGVEESNHRVNRRTEVKFVMNEPFRECYD